VIAARSTRSAASQTKSRRNLPGIDVPRSSARQLMLQRCHKWLGRATTQLTMGSRSSSNLRVHTGYSGAPAAMTRSGWQLDLAGERPTGGMQVVPKGLTGGGCRLCCEPLGQNPNGTSRPVLLKPAVRPQNFGCKDDSTDCDSYCQDKSQLLAPNSKLL
jgi:hypothetical protein